MKAAIYIPSGPAREYAPLACNLYRGCTHGCSYCYASSCLRISREEFHREVTPRPGILEQLRKDAPKYAGGQDSVLLCFTCDPYPEVGSELTREALLILKEHDVPVQVLTKAGARAERDFDVLAGMRARFGVTLVFSREYSRRAWEPGTAVLDGRHISLRRAHSLGIPTFVSLEPIIVPQQALDVIRECAPFADEFRLGKLNHHPAAALVDWEKWAPIIVQAARDTGRAVLVKESLREYVGEAA